MNETKQITNYTRCKNCGNYIQIKTALQNRYCSNECTIYYRQCSTCGKYFKFTGDEKSDAVDIDEKIIISRNTCSKDCSLVYKIFKPRR